MKKHFYLPLLLLFLGFACTNSNNLGHNEVTLDQNKLDSLLQKTINNGLTPGLSVAVVSSTDILYSKAFGLREIGENEALKTTDAFDFSSIVKTVVSSALMKEVEEGSILLDSPAADYLPVLKGELTKPTVRQMLSHSSGIQFSDQEPHPDGLLRTTDLKLVREPGTKLQYSNAAFYTLGQMVLEQSGKTLPEYVEAKLFAPLTMIHSSIHSLEGMNNLTTPHTIDEGELTIVNRPDISSRKIGNGVFYSTIEDMSAWAQFHLSKGKYRNRQVLNPSSYDQLWKPNLNTGWDKMKAAAGLGWFIGEVNGRKTASHIGGTNGYSAALVIFPDDDRAIVIAGNSNKLPREALIRSISEIIFE